MRLSYFVLFLIVVGLIVFAVSLIQRNTWRMALAHASITTIATAFGLGLIITLGQSCQQNPVPFEHYDFRRAP